MKKTFFKDPEVVITRNWGTGLIDITIYNHNEYIHPTVPECIFISYAWGDGKIYATERTDHIEYRIESPSYVYVRMNDYYDKSEIYISRQ